MHQVFLDSLIEQLRELEANNERTRRDSCGQVRPSFDLNNLEVRLYHKGRKRPIGCLSVPHALDCFFNGVDHFEDFDISDADRIQLESF